MTKRTLGDLLFMLPSDTAGCPMRFYKRVLRLTFRLHLISNKQLFPTRFLHENSVQCLVSFIEHTSSPPQPLRYLYFNNIKQHVSSINFLITQYPNLSYVMLCNSMYFPCRNPHFFPPQHKRSCCSVQLP